MSLCTACRRSVLATPVELGSMWSDHGLISVAEAARVLDLIADSAEAGGVLLLDALHIPRGHVRAPDGLASLDPAALLATGEPYETTAAVLWLGGHRLPTWAELVATAPLIEALEGRWQVLDLVIRPSGHASRAACYMQPRPLPLLRGFRIGH